MELGNKAQARIRNWCKRTGYEIGSHIYPRGYFIASTSVGPDVRDWRLVRWNADSTKVEIVNDSPFALKTQALALLAWELAARGVSPTTKPSLTIKDVPFYPRWGV